MARPKIVILDDDFNLGDRISYSMPWCAMEWFTIPSVARASQAYARSSLAVIDADTVRRAGNTINQVVNAITADGKLAIIVSTRANDQVGNITYLQKPLTLSGVRQAVRSLLIFSQEQNRDYPPT